MRQVFKGRTFERDFGGLYIDVEINRICSEIRQSRVKMRLLGEVDDASDVAVGGGVVRP